MPRAVSRPPFPRLAQGGSITAALFLKEFVKETPWAHMDIAGPVWDDKQGGATGYGVGLIAEIVRSVAGDAA